MAWAWAEIVADAEMEAGLACYAGAVHRPAKGASGNALLCPQPGSLASLVERFAANGRRFTRIGNGAKAELLFTQPPKPRFAAIPYDSPPQHFLFDVRTAAPTSPFVPWPLRRAVELVLTLRDAAATRLKQALPEDAATIDRALIGRNATDPDKSARIRIVPLASIGHSHADHAVRRILVERPPDCPIPAGDLSWAFSGIDLGVDNETGEVVAENQAVVTPSYDSTMLRHYGIGAGAAARVWRTVTPAVLPVERRRGRIKGSVRLANEHEAAHAARQALRHAGITAPIEAMRLQREPFAGKGVLAEAFSAGSRFQPQRLWCLEITFVAPVAGPVAIGDGRYCGLGVMAPVPDRSRDVLMLEIRDHCRPPVGHQMTVVGALRRALMSLDASPSGEVSTLFSGHETGPGPASSGHHAHVFLFAADGDGDGLLDRIGIIAPWRVDRNAMPVRQQRQRFEEVASGLERVLAGPAGVLELLPAREPEPDDALFAAARVWTSHTPYRPTRHPRRINDAATAVTQDLLQECLRRGLPRPEVEIIHIEAGPRGGVRAEARLHFNVAVAGPILLGRDAHRGGGHFAGLGGKVTV